MKSSSFQIYNVGDLAFYKPSIKKEYKNFTYTLFLVSKSIQNTWWCGWFDYNGIWREGLIPESKMEKIND